MDNLEVLVERYSAKIIRRTLETTKKIIDILTNDEGMVDADTLKSKMDLLCEAMEGDL